MSIPFLYHRAHEVSIGPLEKERARLERDERSRHWIEVRRSQALVRRTGYLFAVTPSWLHWLLIRWLLN